MTRHDLGAGAPATLPRVSTAIKLAGFYGVVCFYSGIAVPYWPVWLKDRGMDPREIGLLLAAGHMVRIFATPVAGSLADRHGDPRGALIALLIAAMAFHLPFFVDAGFPGLLAASLACSLFQPAIAPIMELATLRGCARAGLDYARVRTSGSITFVAGSFALGAVLGVTGPWIVLPALIATLGLALVLARRLPNLGPIASGPAPRAAPKPVLAPLLALLSNRTFVLFGTSAALIQSSHAVYYGFGTLNWQNQGYEPSMIGALWALGVMAEITLFIFSKPFVRRLGPAWLLIAGAVAGIIRWGWTALSPEPAITIALQILHAASFGAAHLGAMHFITRAVPPEAGASAQTLYGALFQGVFFGLVMLVSGPVFADHGAGVFALSAGLSALGLVAALALARRWRGEVLSL